ncbi:serine hydrolase domain-containing protein [Lysinibacter cavernae]|uniref:CubicO group peptidase (Beta-lactamase class C family) n=1 Tax=Lysinibacter cavernae TaxID=1640652 RepID=A0A7X5QYG7_9MICO|nr:serine hydrolase domain-containing protein [Lysinibacter cavernae]NIH52234.1 CubicO group peptidase (beta-lactamase class C family) [Lysinibacter cavernae]
MSRASGDARPDERLSQLAAGRVAALKAPASFLAVADAQGGLRCGSSGDSGGGTEPALDTQFRIASCTKSFTAARILQLRDAGLLDLDAPITSLLQGPLNLLLPDEFSTTPTPRMLLTMSAGFATDNEWADRQESLGQSALDALLAGGVRFIAEPGTQYEYSNLGYAILGRIAEEICGQPFTTQVEQFVLKPLGLDSIRFAVDPTRDTAVGFSYQAETWVDQPLTGPGAFSPIGGLFASAAELIRWGQWLADAFAPGASDEVLSASSRREMQTSWVQRPSPDLVIGYGFGVFVEQDPALGTVVSHSGGYPGFSSHMRWRIDSGTVAVGFENGTYAGVFEPVRAVLLDAEGADATASAGLQNRSKRGKAGAPWPETQRAVDLVTDLIGAWSDERADEVFTSNVAADLPYALRRSNIEHVVAEIGRPFRIEDVEYPTAAAANWRVRGSGGVLNVAITLHPLHPPRVQSLELSTGD